MNYAVRIQSVCKSYRSSRGLESVQAIDHLSLDLVAGECFALIGESGSGKTTLGLCIAGLLAPDSGKVEWSFEGVGSAGRIQLVFQDAQQSLNPRLTIQQSLEEGCPGESRPGAAERLAGMVGLDLDLLERFPHQISGGQRQRVSLARALAPNPSLLILDEPFSGLDLPSRSRMVEILRAVRASRTQTTLLIGHDLELIEEVADRVGILYQGRLVEVGPCPSVFAAPRHPYTAMLVESSLSRGKLTSSIDPLGLTFDATVSSGCRFRPRCPRAKSICLDRSPELESQSSSGRSVACFDPMSPD